MADELITEMAQPSTPLELREKRIADLAASGTDEAAAALLALADSKLHLRYTAIEALGQFKSAPVREYLLQQRSAGDPRAAAAALRALGRIGKVEAIPQIAEALKLNRVRADGQEDVVCRAGVEALIEIASPEILPVLGNELQEVAGIHQNWDYGSLVVSAIRDLRSEKGAEILRQYLTRLESERGRQGDNPLGQKYIDSKINEAQQALVELAQPKA